jgi:hypothetical protein
VSVTEPCHPSDARELPAPARKSRGEMKLRRFDQLGSKEWKLGYGRVKEKERK